MVVDIKKILLFSILVVFMLLAISFASTVTSDNSKPIRKESPLFNIRTRRAIREKVGNTLRRFIGERIFFLPFQRIREIFKPIFWSKASQDCWSECYEDTCIVETCVWETCNLVKCILSINYAVCPD